MRIPDVDPIAASCVNITPRIAMHSYRKLVLIDQELGKGDKSTIWCSRVDESKRFAIFKRAIIRNIVPVTGDKKKLV